MSASKMTKITEVAGIKEVEVVRYYDSIDIILNPITLLGTANQTTEQIDERVKLAVQDFFTANKIVEDLLAGNRKQIEKISEKLSMSMREREKLIKYKNYVDIQKELNGHD